MNPRKPEFILTLIAGITGTIAGITAILGASFLTSIMGSEEISYAAYASGTEDAMFATSGLFIAIAVITLIIGIALIVFAVFIKRNALVFGILTIIAGVVGFFFANFLWVVPGILAIIAGIMCLARKVPASLS
ncbi:DUF4064 domain-containing protein [Listeria cossartiae]|uniref:DUF4064 domain-containing protein n=1 Tax=Listeria cossartiae TaxID=2838249 RepID=UPI001E36B212|nr:DUF4064 domain-containing protein [Listeria cossartiae]MCD2224083.1 DUF4064 domain-containing protein [Listeria cossartiae]MCD2238760.1 DUF4064 domain-containing protein [Listeria cossartiae]